MQDIQHSFHVAVQPSNGLWYVASFSLFGDVEGKILISAELVEVVEAEAELNERLHWASPRMLLGSLAATMANRTTTIGLSAVWPRPARLVHAPHEPHRNVLPLTDSRGRRQKPADIRFPFP